jgi:hypothetical protein
MILISPSGDVEGPGIPKDVRLPISGCYVLGVSANTMADDAYGDFLLAITLKH